LKKDGDEDLDLGAERMERGLNRHSQAAEFIGNAAGSMIAVLELEAPLELVGSRTQ
jgi:hypothetical protein